MALNAFLRTAECDTGPQARGAPAAPVQPAGETGRRVAVAYQTDEARAAREQRHQGLERGRVEAAEYDVLQPPSEARRDQREDRGRRMRAPFSVAQILRETAADAVPEWIAGSEHHRRTAAAGEHAALIEQHRPATAAIADPGPRQMTFHAAHPLRHRQRL